MSPSVTPLDSIVEKYLASVARACADLPAERREEVLGDLREHIAVARAELAEPNEADVRGILRRLGEPGDIAAEARLDAPAPSYRPQPTPPAPDRGARGWIVWAAIAGAVVVAMLLCALTAVLVVRPGYAGSGAGPNPVPGGR